MWHSGKKGPRKTNIKQFLSFVKLQQIDVYTLFGIGIKYAFHARFVWHSPFHCSGVAVVVLAIVVVVVVERCSLAHFVIDSAPDRFGLQSKDIENGVLLMEKYGLTQAIGTHTHNTETAENVQIWFQNAILMYATEVKQNRNNSGRNERERKHSRSFTRAACRHDVWHRDREYII